MIIPPDPEKDPNIFSPSSSTPSLVALPSEASSLYGHETWDGDVLPPYSNRRSRGSAQEGDVFSDDHGVGEETAAGVVHGDTATGRRGWSGRTAVQPPGLIIPVLATLEASHPRSPSSSLGSITPTAGSLPTFHTHPHSRSTAYISNPQTTSAGATPAATGVNAGSTSKLWESSAAPSGSEKEAKRICSGLLPPLSPKARRSWKNWRKWAYALVVAVLVAIALVVGLIVGRKSGVEARKAKSNPWQDNDGDGDGRRAISWEWGDSLNLTYVEAHDGPSSSEGNLTDCNGFTTLNFTGSPFSSLFTPFSSTSISLASFTFPLSDDGYAPDNFFINARGLGSSGAVTFLGTEASPTILESGEEGVVSVDVIVRYAGQQDLDTMMRVCKMQRDDGGVGVGIYSPCGTDSKVFNPRSLDPASVPTSHIVIRLPPSAYDSTTPSIYFPSVTYALDQMRVRFGNTQGVASFGNLMVMNGFGGLRAGYVEARSTNVITGNGGVKGRWNVSEALFVNVTDGLIAADVILHDADVSNDNTTTLDPTANYASLRRRFPKPPPPSFPAGNIPSATANITTGFFTTKGSIDVRYLHHPPSMSLCATAVTMQGNVAMHLHPNYVGPFAAKTVWGELSIPLPAIIPAADPSKKGRYREVELGALTIAEDSIYARIGPGPNTTTLELSADTVSGTAYWAAVMKSGVVRYEGVKEVLEGKEVGGSEVMVLGALGDVLMTFDGL